MTEYDNTNRWTLNKNDKKREGKQDPDYNGSINVNGVEYWLNGWIKEGKNGKFISGSIKLKDPISSGLPPKQNILPDDDSEDVPF